MKHKRDGARRLKVKCPTCRQEHVYDVSNKFRPFCSERCRTHDIAAWAEGTYRIEGQPVDPEDALAQSPL